MTHTEDREKKIIDLARSYSLALRGYEHQESELVRHHDVDAQTLADHFRIELLKEAKNLVVDALVDVIEGERR